LVLVVRRSRPVLSYVACLGLMSLVCVLFGTYQAGTSLLIGLVASYSALASGVSLGVFIPVLAGFALANSAGPMPGRLGGVLFIVLIMGLAGAGGRLARRLRELTAANIALRELVELQSEATTRAAVEDERGRVARELHDILSHSLGVVVLQTSAAEHAWDADPGRAREALTAARQTATEAVDQLRTLLGVVRDDPGEGRSPVPSLEDLSTLVSRTEAAGFHVELQVTGTPRPVPAAIQASIFRVAQEGIANSLKHSGARGCRIHLAYLTDQVVVQVEDDGRATAPGAGSQLGLVGIRERAALFGGHVQAGPATADGAGWRLQVAFPS
jgi:signal transduction histidine kinase